MAVKMERGRETGIRELMRGLATLQQSKNESLVVKDKIGRPTGELGMCKSEEWDTFCLQCFDSFGWATGTACVL